MNVSHTNGNSPKSPEKSRQTDLRRRPTDADEGDRGRMRQRCEKLKDNKNWLLFLNDGMRLFLLYYFNYFRMKEGFS